MPPYIWSSDRLSQSWIDVQMNLINAQKFIEHVTDNKNKAAWLIKELAFRNISFKVLNLGAGVKKITTEVDTCPKCHGTGKC